MKLLLDFLPHHPVFYRVQVSPTSMWPPAWPSSPPSPRSAGSATKTGKVEPMQWVSLGVIVLFGGATIIAHNETFIKWKPTVLYWLMGGALLVGQLIFKKNLLKSLMGAQMELPDVAWRLMNWSWTGFFAVMGVINLWVAFNFDTDTWVNFKLFGGLGLMAVFVVGQALFLGKYIKEEDDKDAPKDAPKDVKTQYTLSP
jgi:intracellular septation protein